MGPSLFAGENYASRTYYLANAGAQQATVLKAIIGALQQRGPQDMKVSVSQVTGMMGGARDVITVRWSVGHGFVVCFAPGQDLFVSVRVNFKPGCLATLLALLPGYELQPNIFGVDDLNMLLQCITTTTAEQLDNLQLDYLCRDV